MRDSLRRHWPEYLMEAAGLALFMFSAGLFGTLLEYPASPVRSALPDPLIRRALMGAAMGLTAIALVYYPWGRQSGAHYNPAVTLTFLRLGRIKTIDAVFYVIAQFAGGTIGVAVVQALLEDRFVAPPVLCVATLPGRHGTAVAFIAEAAIAAGMMFMVLVTIRSARLMRWTGIFAGLLVATYITLEAPLSGMSMNPARSFASAFPAGLWPGLWLYFSAPPLGMLLAAEAHRRLLPLHSSGCAKMNHATSRRCIFCGSGSSDPAPNGSSPSGT